MLPERTASIVLLTRCFILLHSARFILRASSGRLPCVARRNI